MTKPKPQFNVSTEHELDLDLISEEEAANLLRELGIEEASTKLSDLIRHDAASIDGFFRVEEQAPLTSERAAALKQLRGVLPKLKLNDKLGAVQREQLVESLLRHNAPPDLRDPLHCFTYFQQTLGAWVIEAKDGGKMPLPRPLSPSVRKTASLLFTIDDFTLDLLTNHLTVILRNVLPRPPPSPADPIDALEYCRDRLIEAADSALTEVSKPGPVGQRAVHITISFLGPRYRQLTGRWPVSNANETSVERDPFFRFASALLKAAGYPQSFETLHYAIRRYCQARRKGMQPAKSPDA